MKKFFISLFILGLIFTSSVVIKNFALGQSPSSRGPSIQMIDEDSYKANLNNEEENEVEVKNIEKFMKKHMERALDEIEKLQEEMGKSLRAWGRQSFFALTPSNEVMAGGILENVSSSSFILNTNGFKTNWIIATNTKIVGPNKQELATSSLQNDVPVRVKGDFDGQNLVAEVIIVFQTKTVQPQLQRIENLLKQVVNMLKSTGIDITPLLQMLQSATTTQ